MGSQAYGIRHEFRLLPKVHGERIQHEHRGVKSLDDLTDKELETRQTSPMGERLPTNRRSSTLLLE